MDSLGEGGAGPAVSHLQSGEDFVQTLPLAHGRHPTQEFGRFGYIRYEVPLIIGSPGQVTHIHVYLQSGA